MEDLKITQCQRPKHDIVLHHKEGNLAYEPKEDITPWELAQNTKLLILACSRCFNLDEIYEELTEGAKRHWVKVEE